MSNCDCEPSANTPAPAEPTNAPPTILCCCSTTANAVDRIDYLVIAAGNINAVASLDVK